MGVAIGVLIGVLIGVVIGAVIGVEVAAAMAWCAPTDTGGLGGSGAPLAHLARQRCGSCLWSLRGLRQRRYTAMLGPALR